MVFEFCLACYVEVFVAFWADVGFDVECAVLEAFVGFWDVGSAVWASCHSVRCHRVYADSSSGRRIRIVVGTVL